MFHTSLSPFNHKDARIFFKNKTNLVIVTLISGGSNFFPSTMGIPPIFNIASQLVLPIGFPLSQTIMVPLLYLVNYLEGYVLIPTSPITPIMAPQSPNLIFDLLFVSGMPLFECVACFPHILPSTPPASSQINHKRTFAV